MLKSTNDSMLSSTTDPGKIKEFRQATIARIKEAKLESEKKRIIEEVNKKKEAQAFRIKWREKVKQKRQEEIIEVIDKLTVKESLPELQSSLRKSKKQVNLLQEKAENEKNLQSLISDLEGHDARDYLALSRDSGAFKLSISGDKVPSIEFSSGVNRRLSVQYLQKIAAFGLQVENRISKIGDSSRDRTEFPVSTLEKTYSSSSGGSFPGAKEKYGFSVTNDVQLCNLVQELVSEGPDDQRRLSTGFMESLLNLSTKKAKPVVERTLERRNTLTSEMFAQRQASMFVKMPHSYDADEHKGIVSVCDGYYLVGPGRASMVDGMTRNLGDNSSSNDPKRNSKISFKPFTVEPQVLSTNFRHELPPEMIELLPSYCYPSGVQIKGSENNTQILSQPHRSSVGNREEAGLPPTGPGATAAAPADAKKPPKKPRVFFPSDYSMKATSAATTTTTTTTVPSTTSGGPPSPESISRSSSKTTFLIKLGDHTYQYYCLCILTPVTLFDEASRMDFETSYCLCLLMKFPLVSVVWNVIELDESIVFQSPVDAVSEGEAAAHPGVRAIEDLIVKLKALTFQAYPYFMKANASSSDEKIEQTNLSIDPTKRSNDYIAFMADLSFASVLSGHATYRRAYFQRYYSSFPLTYDQLPDDQITKIHQTLGKAKFVPGSTHRSERELEETFHLLLWSLPVLVNYLLLDQIVLALGCAMMEMKIIVCHKDANVVSGIIMALINLLRPLKWCSPLIISLPDALTDFIDSPVPIIVGLRQLPPNFELQERCVLIDPDVKKIHFHPKDLIENQTIILPNGSRLAHFLRSITNTIKTVTRKKRLEKLKLMKLKKIITKNELAGTHSTSNTAIAAAMAVEKAAQNPLSFENDASSEDCAALCGAVNQFSATVSNHILALVNTAIQFQTDERRIARDKRRVVKQNTAPVSSDSNPERRRSQRIHDLTKLTLLQQQLQHQDESPSDISALDDSVSDITYTDMSSHRKNGSGTEISSEESVNSTTSSLPSIRTGAPILAIKELRPYEQTFITKLTETQMYSNYCQAKKSESPPATVAEVNVSSPTPVTPDAAKGGINGVGAAAVNGGGVVNGNVGGGGGAGGIVSSAADGGSREGHSAGPTAAAATGSAVLPTTPSFVSHLLDLPQAVDGMVELFYIMLNGAASLPGDTITMYQQEYERIYAKNHTVFTPTSCEHVVTDVTLNPLRKVGHSRRRLQRLLDKLLDDMAEKELSKVDIQAEELRYCSGLLCNGFCNSESCDNLCLAIWQRKVRLLRKRQAALQIVTNKFESAATKATTSAAGSGEAGGSGGGVETSLLSSSMMSGRAGDADQVNGVVTTATTNAAVTTTGAATATAALKCITADGVRLEAIKHGKETTSQYLLRQKVIDAQLSKAAAARDQSTAGRYSDSNNNDHKMKHRRKVRVRAMAKEMVDERLKIRVKTFSDSNNRYVTALAKHYASKENKYLKHLRKKSKACIYRALFRYVHRCRAYKRRKSIILIQSNFRGYVVRKQIPILVQELYARISQRMIQRCLATIRIRNHIRKNAETILNVFERKKIARRLAKTNIPVRHSVTGTMTGGNAKDAAAVGGTGSAGAGTGTGGAAQSSSAAMATGGGAVALGGPDGKRQLTVNERYISDAAPGLMTTATAMLPPTPKNIVAGDKPTTNTGTTASVVGTATTPATTTTTAAAGTAAGGAPFVRPQLQQMHSTSSIASGPSDATQPGKSEAMPPQPPKRRNSGSGSSLSSAAYDFMVHGIKRRSIQESFRHPFAHKRFSSTSTSPPPPPTSSAPPPAPTGSGKASGTNGANVNGPGSASAAGVASSTPPLPPSETPSGSHHPRGSGGELLLRTGSANSVSSDDVVGPYAPSNTPLNASPTSVNTPVPISGRGALLVHDLYGGSQVSSAATSPSNASLVEAQQSQSQSQSHSQRTSGEFPSPEATVSGKGPRAPSSSPPMVPAGIAEMSASPIPFASTSAEREAFGHSHGRLMLSTETLMLSPFSTQQSPVPPPGEAHGALAATPTAAGGADTAAATAADGLFSPTSFPIVSMDYDESDDEEMKANRVKTMERKMKLNMLEKSRSRDFISSSSNDLLGINIGSKSRSHEDLMLIPAPSSKSGDDVFSAFGDGSASDRGRSLSDPTVEADGPISSSTASQRMLLAPDSWKAPSSSSADSSSSVSKSANTIRTSLSLGPNHQPPQPTLPLPVHSLHTHPPLQLHVSASSSDGMMQVPTPRTASSDTISSTSGPPSSAAPLSTATTATTSSSYRSPMSERKNVTPIGRYTQSQHMIIPITTNTTTTSVSPRVSLGATAAANDPAAAWAAMNTGAAYRHGSMGSHHSAGTGISGDGEHSHSGGGLLPPTHPRHGHIPLPGHVSLGPTDASSSPTRGSPKNLNHAASMPVMRSNSPLPTGSGSSSGRSGKLSHTSSADQMATQSSSPIPGNREASLSIQAAAAALLTGNGRPAAPGTPLSPTPGIASGYNAPNVSPMPGTTNTTVLVPTRTLVSVPSTGETVIDEKELFALSPSASFRFNISEFDDHDEFEEETQNLERQFPVFKTLGEPVFEVYSRQQRDAILTLWERLVTGVEVKKHSRNSKPKMKVVFCDRAMLRISWKTPASKTFFGGAYNRLTGGAPTGSSGTGAMGNGGGTGVGGGAGGGGGGVDSDPDDDLSSFPLQALRRISSTSEGNGRYSMSKLDSDRVIEFKDIVEIRTDATSDVLRRSESKGYLYGSYPTISLLTGKRSLDFEVTDERLYGELLQGFTLIRNYYQRYLKEEQSNESTGFALWHHKETSTKGNDHA